MFYEGRWFKLHISQQYKVDFTFKVMGKVWLSLQVAGDIAESPPLGDWGQTHCPVSYTSKVEKHKKYSLFITFDHITVTALAEDTKDNFILMTD